jgi:hypothetical protein
MYYYNKYVKNVRACIEEHVEREGACMKREELVCEHNFRSSSKLDLTKQLRVHGTRRHVH